MKPSSASPSLTAAISLLLSIAVQLIPVRTPCRAAAVCSDTSHRGINCSATVSLATTLSPLRRSARNYASPASTRCATSSTWSAHPATTSPAAFYCVPRVCASLLEQHRQDLDQVSAPRPGELIPKSRKMAAIYCPLRSPTTPPERKVRSSACSAPRLIVAPQDLIARSKRQVKVKLPYHRDKGALVSLQDATTTTTRSPD